MNELYDRMEMLRSQRAACQKKLNQNTIAVRLIVVEAHAAGHGTREIAKLLGVTTRTVYAWLRG